MSDLVVAGPRTPAGNRPFYRWHRRPANRYRGTVRELRTLLPRFERRSVLRGIHQIVRVSPGSDNQCLVVGEVSPEYVLVQHEDLLKALLPVLCIAGFDLNEMVAELTVTTPGERMELLIEVPSLGIMPPDGFPLACRLRCVNSVDGSTALAAELQWYRQICNNGMFGWCGDGVRRVHRFRDVLGSLQRRLSARFKELPGDQVYFSQLLDSPLGAGALRDWLDVFVNRRWSRVEAARVYHICLTGTDGSVHDHDPESMPHELELRETFEVPGACAPARNVYHAGQALSWVAGHSEMLEKIFSRTASVPSLLQHLLN